MAIANAVRTNQLGIYAKVEGTSGTAESLGAANLIPVLSATEKTFLNANTVDRTEVKGYYGASGTGLSSKTQSLVIQAYIRSGGAGTGDFVNVSPLSPLFQACGHAIKNHPTKDISTGATTTEATNAVIRSYTPDDDAPTTATILYKVGRVTQQMVGARGTFSFTEIEGEYAVVTFEFQAAYIEPVSINQTRENALSGSTTVFRPATVCRGSDTIRYPALPQEFGNCVTSFSFNQGAVVSPLACATREGNKDIEYFQGGRSATGEIVTQIDPAKLGDLFSKAGEDVAVSASLNTSGSSVGALSVLNYGKAGEIFFFAADAIKIGTPVYTDTDGVGFWTTPLTFEPTAKNNDYIFGFAGSLA